MLWKLHEQVPWLSEALPQLQGTPEPRAPAADVLQCPPGSNKNCYLDLRFKEEHDEWERMQARIALQPKALSYQNPKAKAAQERYRHLACDSGQALLWNECEPWYR